MKELKFRYVSAKNFLCFGPEGIEITFDNYGEVTLVTGVNLDTGTEANPSSNASGKCFSPTQEILMFDGTVKQAKDIEVGDLLMGNDSTPRKVLSLCSGKEMMYEVKPKKGDSYIVNESHTLTLKNADRKGKNQKNHPTRVGTSNVYNISVKEYLKQSGTFKNLMKGYRTDITFKPKPTKIDPYFLGLWLGDGSSDHSSITTADQKIVNYIHQIAQSRHVSVTKYSKKNTKCAIYNIVKKCQPIPSKACFLAYKLKFVDKMKYKDMVDVVSNQVGRKMSIGTIQYWVSKAKKYLKNNTEPIQNHNNWRNSNTIMEDLHSYNLINNKHVPHIYKTNDRETRLQILAGLMDTDGSLSDKCFDFVNKNKTLAEDVVYLCRSLGLAAYMKKCKKKDQNGTEGTYWRVSISGNCDIVPTKLPHKQSPPRAMNKDVLRVGIDVKPIGEGEYCGFTVDGNNLFLLGDFTVVHNSSIIDTIAYCLYGKTAKRPKKLDHTTVINAITKKKLEVIVEVNDLKVIRCREPNKLEIHKNGINITPGGKGEAQKLIDREIGLSHTAFCSVVVFDDSNTYSFLELDLAGKRSLVENLLGLDRYKEYHETAKEASKDIKTLLKDLTKDYERYQNDLETANKRIDKITQQEQVWQRGKEQELEHINKQIKQKQSQLDIDPQRITVLTTSIASLEAKRDKLVSIIKESKTKNTQVKNALDDFKETFGKEKILLHQLEKDKEKKATLIKTLENLELGATCPVCYGEIAKANYQNVLTHETNAISGLHDKIRIKKLELAEKEAELKKKAEFTQKLSYHIGEAEAKLEVINNTIRTEKTELASLSVDTKSLENSILELKKQLVMSPSPYKEILEAALQEKVSKEKELAENIKGLRGVEKDIPYYEFWVDAFGDKGIRKYVLDGIVPTLNARIAYWMQFLIDSKIELTFDSEFQEKVLVCGLETDYHAMSNGEKRRINLAVSQAFAYVMMLNSGSLPSIVFLDEITGGGIDKAGVSGIYNMIFELAKERQVFVTSHNETLLNLLQGCDMINLIKKNGISKIDKPH